MGKKVRNKFGLIYASSCGNNFFLYKEQDPAFMKINLNFFLYGQKRRSYHPAFSLIFFIYFSHSVKRSRELTLDLF